MKSTADESQALSLTDNEKNGRRRLLTGREKYERGALYEKIL